MKKKIITLVLIAVALATGIFATPVKVNVSSQVLTAFSDKFTGATEVSWHESDEYVKASFKIDEQVLFAYFTVHGELIGVSRNLLSTQIPFNLGVELKKISANGWISELFEFTNGTETTYYVIVENASQKVQYQSFGFNNWSVIKKIKKN